MSRICEEKLNPARLKRDGVHQGQRLVAALDPAFAKVDEHEPAHWMVFAGRYAAYIRFFEKTNVVTGEWEVFFRNNPAAYLAIAAVQNVDDYRVNLQEFSKFLLNIKKENDVAGLRQNLGNLFNCTGTLAWQLEQLQKALPESVPLKAVLKNLILSQLAPGLARLVRYYRAARNPAFPASDDISDINETGDIDLSAPLDWDVLGADVVRFDMATINNFSNDWIANVPGDWFSAPPPVGGFTSWAAFSAALKPDTSIYGDPLHLTTFKRLNQAAAHNLFASIFEQFLKAYSRTVAEAKRSLQTIFEKQDDHEPHYALFLAFLRLLTNARDYANTLTARHLDFYYKDVLLLKTKPAVSNEAHLTVELAKHADSHLLAKGTRLKAGKDSAGKDVFYEIVEDFVANKAKVEELKTVFHYQKKTTDLLQNLENGRLFASPKSDSADGIGAELTNPDKQWHPFANKVYKGEQLEKLEMPLADIGFAIASHYLWMREGERTVTLHFNGDFNEKLLNADLVNLFTVALTGEKGWVAGVVTKATRIGNQLAIRFILDGDQPAIVPLSTKIHGEGLEAGLPVARVRLKNETGVSYGYNMLKDLKINSLKIEVSVNGIKNLALSNDFGVIDPSKPFQPFGAIPKVGAALVLGNKELFQKQWSSKPVLHIVWQHKVKAGLDSLIANVVALPIASAGIASGPTVFNNFIDTVKQERMSFLSKGEWGSTSSLEFLESQVNLTQTNLSPVPVEFEPDETYDPSSKSGYARFVLYDDFGYDDYFVRLARFLARPPQGPDPGELPLVPVITAISLDYSASQNTLLTSGLSTRQARFYHLHPFGYTEEHYELNEGKAPSLLPLFQMAKANTAAEQCLPQGDGKTKPKAAPSDTGQPVENEAEFYIGVSGLKPPQNLALLFQLAEGSANPKTVKPDDHIQWSYLSNNGWFAFKREEVNDRTGQLLRSGIVTLSVPREATSANTRLAGGLHWLRASISRQVDEAGQPIATTTDAACKIIKVAAQATRAVFADNLNAADFLEQQLPASTISKLVQPQAEVKKVEQPYPTYGGRPVESDTHYYTRISERLRHKQRAITVWDYERLVLEAFPHIYKVKSLNHTRFVPTEQGLGSYNELAPGHVTCITIPNLRNHNAIDPLRPFTSLGDLDAIGKFLKKHVSCHVGLHVHNPVFEPVRVDFCVKFHTGVDEAFHLRLLKTEITRFLSPWAFDQGKDIGFGGRIFKSSLINFVEEQAYVDFVTDFKLFHAITDVDGKNLRTIDVEEIEASTAISILVSAAETEHTVRAIPAEVTDIAGERCNC